MAEHSWPAPDFDRVYERTGTWSVKWDLRESHFGRADVVPLWVADMDFRVPEPVVEALTARAASGLYGYVARPPAFAEAVTRWQARRHGWDIPVEWVSYSPGVVSGLSFLVMTFSQPGDGVLIQPPVYHPFRHLIEQLGRTVVENPLRLNGTHYEMDLADFSQKARQARLMILCNPHNPVGRVWSREELGQLRQAARTAGLLVLADEVHGDLVYPPHEQIPFQIAGAGDDRVITLVAPSKTFSLAGLKTSAVIIPDERKRTAYEETISHLGVGIMGTFGTEAAIAAYRHGAYWLDALLPYLAANIQRVQDFLSQEASLIRPVPTEGTYLMWLDCRALQLDDEALQRFFVEAGLGVESGSVFGAGGSGFIRMNVACPRPLLEQALEGLGAHYRRRGWPRA